MFHSLETFGPGIYEGLSMCALPLTPPDSFHPMGEADSPSCEKCKKSPNQFMQPEFHLAVVITAVSVDCSVRGWCEVQEVVCPW